MVINNDPCYAYLMRCNHTVDQKLVMAHVYGHCLAPETLIETRDGVKPITEVRAGDEVLTHKGVFKRVRVVARRWFCGEIFCLRLEGWDEVVRITGEHPVGIAHADYELKWVLARDLGGGMLVAAPHPREPIGVNGVAAPSVAGHWMEEEEPHTVYDARYEWNSIAAPRREHYEGYVYNFSVEEDESYTLAAGMVVHNCDFFKNNAYFAHTNRKMMDEMANHGVRIRRYAEKHGEDEVEAFIDRCMSIDDLIDIHSTAIRRREDVSRYDFKEEEEEALKLTRFKSKDYMDTYINPEKALKAEEEERRKLKEQTARSFPERPEKDVLLFLIEHAPLKGWQRDVLSIVRDEAYYFAPQGQTKVINEGWACADRNTLLFTDKGCLRLGDVVDRKMTVGVSDGETARAVYDWACFPKREIVEIHTQRGFILKGSTTHRILMADGSWRRLDQCRDLAPAAASRVRLSKGPNLWAKEFQTIVWKPEESRRLAGSSGGTATATRRTIRLPQAVGERLGLFLGSFLGAGSLSATAPIVACTVAEETLAERLGQLMSELFNVSARKSQSGSKWLVALREEAVHGLLSNLGVPTRADSRTKRTKDVPDIILRSPKSVVAAFLRGLFETNGVVTKDGIRLRTSSAALTQTVQLLLLNFGILSTRISRKLQVTGKSASVFKEEIGFDLEVQRAALERYVNGPAGSAEEVWEDTIAVVIKPYDRADVYDISVAETHRYAAQGFINHNSYWHSTIMTERALEPWECVDYADHHSGTMATQRGRINPYKLGIELLRDIEHRWNTGKFGKEYDDCDNLDERRKWDKKLGLGRKKIFEVRRVHNDITFIDTFLTPEFCAQHKMFAYNFNDQAGQYVIESREFEKIKKRLLFSLTNFGKPWIYVVDGNYRNRGELLLRHEHNGIDLRLDRAADTLANVQFIWGRPVHLQTVADEKPSMMSYDGSEHSLKTLGDADDPRRNPAAKTK
jgi:stage V sporulation protein R